MRTNQGMEHINALHPRIINGGIIMIQRCSKCGREIDETVEYVRIVGHGLDCETVMCEECFDRDLDSGKLVSCEACDKWFAPDVLRDEALDETHSFTACPCCAKDIVSGQTREEMTQDVGQFRYAVIVTFVNGYDRGYIVHARGRSEALRKTLSALDKRGDGHAAASVVISEVLLEVDELL